MANSVSYFIRAIDQTKGGIGSAVQRLTRFQGILRRMGFFRGGGAGGGAGGGLSVGRMGATAGPFAALLVSMRVAQARAKELKDSLDLSLEMRNNVNAVNAMSERFSQAFERIKNAGKNKMVSMWGSILEEGDIALQRLGFWLTNKGGGKLSRDEARQNMREANREITDAARKGDVEGLNDKIKQRAEARRQSLLSEDEYYEELKSQAIDAARAARAAAKEQRRIAGERGKYSAEALAALQRQNELEEAASEAASRFAKVHSNARAREIRDEISSLDENMQNISEVGAYSRMMATGTPEERRAQGRAESAARKEQRKFDNMVKRAREIEKRGGELPPRLAHALAADISRDEMDRAKERRASLQAELESATRRTADAVEGIEAKIDAVLEMN